MSSSLPRSDEAESAESLLDTSLEYYEKLLEHKRAIELELHDLAAHIRTARESIAVQLHSHVGHRRYRRRGITYRAYRDLGGFQREKEGN